MGEREEGMEAVAPQRGLKESPEDLREKRTASGYRGKKAKRLDGGAKIETGECDVCYVPRRLAVKKVSSVK